MKKLGMLAILSLVGSMVFAQNVDLRRKIEVTGVAEQEVTPDIINVSISLQEYMDGKKKVTIDQLESQLENAVKEAGIAKEYFMINNVSAWNNTWQKKKNPDFLASKQYTIRLHDLNKFDPIISSIDPRGIQSTSISGYDYSKMPELKRELKIQALLAAKEKATYLLNSIGEKLGRPIEINENDNSNYPMATAYANRVMFKSNQVANDSDIDFKKIKLSFEMHVIF
ncbi:MAG TPA: SIMPL domain-containing protein, partial [Mucilaginibacter sp.]|nr:SIMPL domain-containing protein [Mucilaginibacter sp.]